MFFLMFGIFIVNWGEEQVFYVFENIVGNYFYGCQFMILMNVWEFYGCYKVGFEKYFNFFFDVVFYGCDDFNVSFDYCDFLYLI